MALRYPPAKKVEKAMLSLPWMEERSIPRHSTRQAWQIRVTSIPLANTIPRTQTSPCNTYVQWKIKTKRGACKYP